MNEETERQQRAQSAFDQMNQLLTRLVAQAEQLSLQRCPYKNRFDHCTAEFRCRNQLRLVVTESGVSEPAPMACTGDDKLDYRPAWEQSV
jgi:predicted RecB family nuclease